MMRKVEKRLTKKSKAQEGNIFYSSDKIHHNNRVILSLKRLLAVRNLIIVFTYN